MVMDREEHEALLNKLNDTEITHEERTETLQKLRTDYVNVLDTTSELSETKEKLEKDNEDLVMSNSKLFRQLGTEGDPKLEEKEEQKGFSERITISEIENKVKE